MAPLNDATHFGEFYEQITYYKLFITKHLNQVSEEWQGLISYEFWNNGWQPVGPGFCPRNLRRICR